MALIRRKGRVIGTGILGVSIKNDKVKTRWVKKPPQSRKKAPRTKDISIKAAEEIAKKYGYDQIVIIGRKTGTDENAREHCTTYGVNKEHCKVAAQIGDFLKHKVMGWKQ